MNQFYRIKGGACEDSANSILTEITACMNEVITQGHINREIGFMKDDGIISQAIEAKDIDIINEKLSNKLFQECVQYTKDLSNDVWLSYQEKCRNKIMVMVQDYVHRKDNWMTDFLYEALSLGYSYNDAWECLSWILSHPGYYDTRDMLGRKAASRYICCPVEHNCNVEPNISRVYALVLLIELAHNNFNMPYDKIFSKMSLDEFVNKCGDVIGDYDDRLIKMYLL